MRNLPHLLSAVACEPVMMLPSIHASVLQSLVSIIQGDTTIEAAAGGARTSQRIHAEVIENVAIIPLHGMMMKHASSLAVMCDGVCCLEQVTEDLHAASMDPRIDRIVLWCNTPGGHVVGTPELAAVVRGIAESAETEIVAFTDSQCCSAGYYVASQANALLSTVSANVGSINTRIAFLDQSEAFAKAGFKMELFTTGKFKGMGLPGTALSEEQRDYLDGEVSRLSEDFHRAVQDGRGGDVPALALEGQTFSGQGAIDHNLVDAIVADIDAAIEWEPSLD